jgi:hypothetical protein
MATNDSLLVKITNIGNTLTYGMKAETVDHMFTRFATQSPLPAQQGTTGSGSVFILDLGMGLEQVSVTGVVDVVSSTSGEPTKFNLEDVSRSWWNYTNFGVDTTQLPKLTLESGQVYTVALKQSDFKRIAGQESQFWEYNIIFYVAAKV